MKSSVFSKTLAVILSVSTLASSMVASALEIETIDQPIVDDQTIITTSSWKDKIQPYLLEVMEKETGKIPVWLWMEDIDHEEAEREVFDRTGLNEANLSVISEPISQELAEDIAKLPEASSQKRDEVREEFRHYLDKTKDAREQEAERVDTYTRELRDTKREMINEKTSSIFKTLRISENDVIAKDELAPVYTVYLDKHDIERVAQNPKVTAIYYYDMDAKDVDDGNTLLETMTASTVSRIKSELGLTGEGVKLGVIEGGVIQDCSDLDISRVNFIDANLNIETDHSHVTNVTRIAAGNDGVASSADIYYSNQTLTTSMRLLIEEDVHVANFSRSSETRSENDYYSVREKYVDYLSRNYKFLLVKTAGNQHGVLKCPGLAYNALTVGGFHNQGTTAQSDDKMYSLSNYDNFGTNGCAKPDLVADQSNINGTGTSYAAPFVTGVVALLYELRPSLQAQPEAVKAILMSSCHRKVTQRSGDPVETMAEGVTEHQGTGAIDPYMAIAVAGSGNYGYRTMDSSVTQENINFKQFAYGSTGLNVSLAWSVNNPDQNTAGPFIDLDLSLLRGSTVLGTSSLANSSTEMVYVTPSSSATQANYTIRVNRSSATGTAVRYAYAFSVDNYRYQYSDENEGIFLIRNKATGKYLTNSNNNVYQKSHSGGVEQQWLIKDGIIYSASTQVGKVAIGTALSDVYTRATVSDSAGALVKLVSNQSSNQYDQTEGDGSVRLNNEATGSSLGIYNESTSNVAAAWSTDEAGNAYQSWYLEPVGYQKGDVNTDGVISSVDSDIVLNYITNSVTLTECQKYLADVNGDGVIQTIDCLLIQRITAGEF